jgi:hypothetical protein
MMVSSLHPGVQYGIMRAVTAATAINIHSTYQGLAPLGQLAWVISPNPQQA